MAKQQQGPTPAQAAKAAEAFAQIVAAGQRPTVRALKERAEIGTEAARQWLAAHRASAGEALPPIPRDRIEAMLTPIWGAAVAAARAEVAEVQAAEINAHADAEAIEAERADAAEAKAADLDGEVKALRTALAAAKTKNASFQDDITRAETEARERSAAAHAAEREAAAAAARAEAAEDRAKRAEARAERAEDRVAEAVRSAASAAETLRYLVEQEGRK